MNAAQPTRRDDGLPLLAVENLSIRVATQDLEHELVDGVSLSVPAGSSVALVGESGCGKTVTMLAILRLLPSPPIRISAESIRLHANTDRQHSDRAYPPRERGGSESRPDAVDLLHLPERRMRHIRGRRVAMIFQDPTASLNPVYSVGAQIVEAIRTHLPLSRRQARRRAIELLDRVGIVEPDRRFRDFPHQLSGGMCQRVMIAMALSAEPDLLIADEPTTALDVTIQSQILALLADLQRSTGMSVLLVTHDLDVVAAVADYVYVMYAGRIVEHAPAAELLSRPLHPYTQALMRCRPTLGEKRSRLPTIDGSVPEPGAFPTGCRFHPRCQLAASIAAQRNQNATHADAPTCVSFSPPNVHVPRRCAFGALDPMAPHGAEPSTSPPLVEHAPHHFVACWEAADAPGFAPADRHTVTSETVEASRRL